MDTGQAETASPGRWGVGTGRTWGQAEAVLPGWQKAGTSVLTVLACPWQVTDHRWQVKGLQRRWGCEVSGSRSVISTLLCGFRSMWLLPGQQIRILSLITRKEPLTHRRKEKK